MKNIPVMLQKLTAHCKDHVACLVTALVLLVLAPSLAGPLPLTTVTRVSLCSMSKLSLPCTVPASPELAPSFQVHLLLHLPGVLHLLSLQVLLVKAPEPSGSHMGSETDPRGSDSGIAQDLVS